MLDLERMRGIILNPEECEFEDSQKERRRLLNLIEETIDSCNSKNDFNWNIPLTDIEKMVELLPAFIESHRSEYEQQQEFLQCLKKITSEKRFRLL